MTQISFSTHHDQIKSYLIRSSTLYGIAKFISGAEFGLKIPKRVENSTCTVLWKTLLISLAITANSLKFTQIFNFFTQFFQAPYSVPSVLIVLTFIAPAQRKIKSQAMQMLCEKKNLDFFSTRFDVTVFSSKITKNY